MKQANDAGDLADQMESDKEIKGQAEAIGLLLPKRRSLVPENKAKNQVEATKDEIASSCASGSQQIICS